MDRRRHLGEREQSAEVYIVLECTLTDLRDIFRKYEVDDVGPVEIDVVIDCFLILVEVWHTSRVEECIDDLVALYGHEVLGIDSIECECVGVAYVIDCLQINVAHYEEVVDL